jgi:opacity protein-like surface antigen
MRFFKAVLTVAALVLIGGAMFSPQASAQFYVSGSAGGVFVMDSNVTASAPAVGGMLDADYSFDPGYGVSGAVGYDFGQFRLEGELSYREADLDSVTVNTVTGPGVTLTGLGTFPASGSGSIFGFMANGWYDFDTGTPWVPYLGGGIGGAMVGFDVAGLDETDTVFAYQVGGGIGYEINSNVTVSLGYRLLGTTSPTFEGPVAGFGNVEAEADVLTHNVELGLRVTF